MEFVTAKQASTCHGGHNFWSLICCLRGDLINFFFHIIPTAKCVGIFHGHINLKTPPVLFQFSFDNNFSIFFRDALDQN